MTFVIWLIRINLTIRQKAELVMVKSLIITWCTVARTQGCGIKKGHWPFQRVLTTQPNPEICTGRAKNCHKKVDSISKNSFGL